MSAQKRVAIIGGGVGAFSTALACQRAGMKPMIFEKSRSLLDRSGSSGMALWYNGALCLKKLLPAEKFNDLLDVSAHVTNGGMRSWKGDMLAPFDFDLYKKKCLEKGIPAYGLALERVDLLEVLSSCIPPECIHFGEQFDSYHDEAAEVSASDGNTSSAEKAAQTEQQKQHDGKTEHKPIIIKFKSGMQVEADVLVGAEGVNSAVRAQAFPNIPVLYSGYTSWRTICHYPASPLLPDGYTGESWGAGKRVGLIRLDEEYVYYYMVAEAQENQADPLYIEELKANLTTLFGHFHEPIKHLIEISEAKEIRRSDVMTIEPLTNYSNGRVVLVGDSAHGASPNLGWSNCISIEDGAQLAQSLYVNPNNVLEALKHYNSIRIPRNHAVQKATSQFVEMGQLEGNWTGFRDKLLRMLPESLKKGPFELFDYEVAMDFIDQQQQQAQHDQKQ